MMPRTSSSGRRQFNASSDLSEEVILDYQRHQRRLLPRLAATYAASFAHEELLEKFDGVFSGTSDERPRWAMMSGRADVELAGV